MGKKDAIQFESYGAHLRNLLGPYQNMVCIIDDWLNGHVDTDFVKKLLSNKDLQKDIDAIIEFSKYDKMENINWRENK